MKLWPHVLVKTKCSITIDKARLGVGGYTRQQRAKKKKKKDVKYEVNQTDIMYNEG